ncbi:MAG TPA: glycosyltransferase family 2 protein [Solirubrobacteraceae bacterium]|jgi:glycosyltransferase involved in cell wall biosynthesis|nr:glycosyltransferase family 2 protein [Solirubrobacteraceae bacterium]
MTADTLIIVAAYNEAERIGETLGALAEAFPGAPVWVADDGSTDDTASLAGEAGARVVRSERMIGKGGAVTQAALAALEHATGLGAAGADREPVFVLCDADLGASAGRLTALVGAVRDGQAELAVAAFARRVGGGLGVAVGFARWAIRRRCGFEATAPISGQRALSARVLQDVLPFAPDFGMEVGMTIDAVRAGYRVNEIELELEHRATGRTPAGFLHRGRQLVDFVRVYVARR